VLLAVFLGFEHAAIAAVLVGLAAGAIILGGSLFVFLRFCLGGPLILDQGKLLLFDSWTLTRGSTDRLLGLSLCLLVVTVVLEIVIGALLLTSAAAFFSALPGGLTGFFNALHQSPDTALASVAPFLIGVALIGTPIAGALQTIIAAPWASAYRDLTAGTATDLVA